MIQNFALKKDNRYKSQGLFKGMGQVRPFPEFLKEDFPPKQAYLPYIFIKSFPLNSNSLKLGEDFQAYSSQTKRSFTENTK